MHGREAIVLGSLCITTVDHGAKGLPFAPCHMTDWSFAHARPERDRARARGQTLNDAITFARVLHVRKRGGRCPRAHAREKSTCARSKEMFSLGLCPKE